MAQLALQWVPPRPSGDPRRWSAPRPWSSSTPTWMRWSSLDLTDDELARVDEHAVEAGINLWAGSSAH